jgi:uncharacterized protein YaiI (UPF0178 family)
MRIVVDADSCPRDIRGIVIKAAEKNNVPLLFVANRPMRRLSNRMIPVTLPATPDSVDAYILQHANKEDLVITRDIPLAADLVHREVCVINDRGDKFTSENIDERLSLRDTMQELREWGLVKHRGRSYGAAEKKKFADTFSKELARMLSGR